MDFKEWLELDEARFKGLKRMFQQQYPGMPAYVQNDLYNTRVGHTMNHLIKNSSNSSSGNRTTGSDLPSDSASKIFNAAGFKNATWNKRPEVLIGRNGQPGVTPADFASKTQRYFGLRLFGYKEVPVWNDKQRTEKQKEIMQARPEGKNEPIIVQQTTQGYELLEGWHRTMNYLLQGAPQDQRQWLASGREEAVDYLNFAHWSPVRILAYVGRMQQVTNPLPGTGDFIPTPQTPSQFSQPTPQNQVSQYGHL